MERSEAASPEGADAACVARIRNVYLDNGVEESLETGIGFAAPSPSGAAPPSPAFAQDSFRLPESDYKRLLVAMRRYRWKGTRSRVCLARKAPPDKYGFS